MDDYNISSLTDSKNEWCVRLLNVLTAPIHEGIRSIFTSARKLCAENKEPDKYLLTFQNLLTRVPQWNAEIIATETSRITQSSNCKYLEDLITCVHIIQLKLLTYARVGTKYKKIDIAIPKINDFIHKVYINCARTMYQQAFLYKLELSTMDIQRNAVTVEKNIKECILNAVRDSIPYEQIVRSYLDETHETYDEMKEDPVSIIQTPSSSRVNSSVAASPLKLLGGNGEDGILSESNPNLVDTSVISLPTSKVTNVLPSLPILMNNPTTVSSELTVFSPPPPPTSTFPSTSTPIPLKSVGISSNIGGGGNSNIIVRDNPPKLRDLFTNDLDMDMDMDASTKDEFVPAHNMVLECEEL